MATAETQVRPTLGETLERRRVRFRLRRLQLVVEALEERRVACQRVGPVPPPLQQALDEFSLEREHLIDRLADLS